MLAQTLQFPWKIPANAVVKVVGVQPITLFRDDYDDRQMWLPFANFVIAHFEKQPEHIPNINIKKRMERVFAIVPNECRPLYLPEKGVPQLPLPFPGWRKITNTQWKRLSDAEFPCWELNDNHQPFFVVFEKWKRTEVENFCEENCKGQYMVKKDFACFELKSDCAIVKLGFGSNERR